MEPGEVSAGLSGTLDVHIDDRDMSFMVGGEFGEPPVAITLAGRLITDAPWVAPFDGKLGPASTQWLTVRELGMALSFNPVSASLGLGLYGDADIASKNLQIDIVLALNVTTGVPTNFAFQGASTTSFSIDDLILLQQQLAAASGGPTVPSGVVPNFEIRPVDPQTPIEVKFAVRNSSDIRQGFALKGALYAPLAPAASLELIAEVDSEISTSGILIYGNAPHDITVAQLSLNQPMVNIALEPLPPSGLFVLRGEVVFPWFTKSIDVELSKEADVSQAIQNITSIVSAWNQFAADPVYAVETSLTGPSGLFAVAGVPEPLWVQPLFSSIGTMQDLFSGSDPQTLLGCALAGVNQTTAPFAGEELGYSFRCLTGGKEADKCWIVPPSWTSTRAKVKKTTSYCKSRNRLGICTSWGTRVTYVCPALTVSSGGKCYNRPPGPPRLASPSTPQQVCLGVQSGGKCWLVPPTPAIETTIPGSCTTYGTSCSVDGLLNGTISTLIKNKVEALVGGVQSGGDAGGGPSPGSTVLDLEFGAGWDHYGGDYAPAVVRKHGEICQVEGLARTYHAGTTTQKHVATLPPECRPAKRLIFNLNNQANTARVDVLPDGKILWVAGGADYRWVSLSGIRFSPGAAGAVTLAAGWQNYGGSYGEVRFHRQGDVCVVQGLVKTSDSTSQAHIATLPAECRPPDLLIFNQNKNNKTARVDIRPDGRISWVAGGTSDGWISLSGIAFGTAGEPVTEFGSGWSNYGGVFQDATVSRESGLCFVNGLLRTSNGSVDAQKHLATLPSDCRPAGQLVFNLNNHDKTARVDVHPDGRVTWVAGGAGYSWISLSGIGFEAN